MPPPAEQNFKITVVGDGYVGKTCMLMAYTTKKPPQNEYIPTVFENYFQYFEWEGVTYGVSLWDTAGQETYDKLRVLAYPNTDCFILCFAVNGHSSFENITSKWIRELRENRPRTPIILVGTKCDCRRVDDPNMNLMSFEHGVNLAKQIKADTYLECSAHEFVGLDDVIAAAVQACVKKLQCKQQRKCHLL